jgi:hypothetical protein
MNKKINNFSDYVYISNDDKLKNIDFKDLFIELNEWFLDTEKETLEKNEIYPNIRKWIRYESLGEDADIKLKTPGENLDIVSKLNWYEKNTAPKYRYLDCIFSLKTHLNMFMRLYEPRGVNHLWLLENMNYVFSEIKINEFCCHNVSDSNKTNIDINVKIVKDCIKGMEELAKYTHTIGNYMPCPDSKYNSIKGFKGHRYFNDRIELVINELLYRNHAILIDNDTARDWNKWFKENMAKLSLTELFKMTNNKNYDSLEFKEELINFPIHNKKFSIDELKQFREYLTAVNTWINDRGETLIQKINTDEYSL